VISLEEFNKLRELLDDFMPVISRIHGNVDKIYKYIEDALEKGTTDGIESHILVSMATGTPRKSED